MTVADSFKKKFPDVPFELLVKIAQHYRKLESHVRYNQRLCAICYSKADVELQPTHTLSTCRLHVEHAHVYQPQLIQKRLGLPSDIPDLWEREIKDAL